VDETPSDGGPGLDDLPAAVAAAEVTPAPGPDDPPADGREQEPRGGGATGTGEAAAPTPTGRRLRRCLRCQDDLRFRGRRALPWTLSSVADPGTYDDVEVYACPTCGRVELFERR
jgi:hypothetical protein